MLFTEIRFLNQSMSFLNFTSKSTIVLDVPSTCTVRLFIISFLSCFKLSSLVVRVRSRVGRRNRAPPPRARYRDGKKINPAVQAAEDAKANAAKWKHDQVKLFLLMFYVSQFMSSMIIRNAEMHFPFPRSLVEDFSVAWQGSLKRVLLQSEIELIVDGFPFGWVVQ
jgi:hypothetical protein